MTENIYSDKLQQVQTIFCCFVVLQIKVIGRFLQVIVVTTLFLGSDFYQQMLLSDRYLLLSSVKINQSAKRLSPVP